MNPDILFGRWFQKTEKRRMWVKWPVGVIYKRSVKQETSGLLIPRNSQKGSFTLKYKFVDYSERCFASFMCEGLHVLMIQDAQKLCSCNVWKLETAEHPSTIVIQTVFSVAGLQVCGGQRSVWGVLFHSLSASFWDRVFHWTWCALCSLDCYPPRPELAWLLPKDGMRWAYHPAFAPDAVVWAQVLTVVQQPLYWVVSKPFLGAFKIRSNMKTIIIKLLEKNPVWLSSPLFI